MSVGKLDRDHGGGFPVRSSPDCQRPRLFSCAGTRELLRWREPSDSRRTPASREGKHMTISNCLWTGAPGLSNPA